MSRGYLEQHLTIGKSTKDDVRSLFGEPGYKSERSNKEDYWSYTEDQINPDYVGQAMSFLPSLGSLGSAAADSQRRKTSRSLDFFFDSKGRVTDYSTSGSTGADR